MIATAFRALSSCRWARWLNSRSWHRRISGRPFPSSSCSILSHSLSHFTTQRASEASHGKLCRVCLRPDNNETTESCLRSHEDNSSVLNSSFSIRITAQDIHREHATAGISGLRLPENLTLDPSHAKFQCHMASNCKNSAAQKGITRCVFSHIGRTPTVLRRIPF